MISRIKFAARYSRNHLHLLLPGSGFAALLYTALLVSALGYAQIVPDQKENAVEVGGAGAKAEAGAKAKAEAGAKAKTKAKAEAKTKAADTEGKKISALKAAIDAGEKVDLGKELISAAHSGHQRVAQFLLQQGAKLDAKDSYGWTPLHRAASRGHQTIVQLLIGRGANVNTTTGLHWNETPLHKAARSGREKSVKLLLAGGAKPNAVNKDGRSPLFFASQANHIPVVKLLLKAGPSQQHKNMSMGEPALRGYVESLEILIKAGAQIDNQDHMNRTPLALAVTYNQVTSVRVLLKHGAKANATDGFERNLLHTAVRNGNKTIATLLIKKGGDVNGKDKNGNTPIFPAVWHEGMVQLLIEHGAKVDVINRKGQSAATAALPTGNRKLIDLLVAKGAPQDEGVWAALGKLDQIIKGFDGATDRADLKQRSTRLLVIAALYGHKEIVAQALDRGASINPENRFYGLAYPSFAPGKYSLRGPALHLATHGGHMDVVKLLLDRGAQFRQRNKDQDWSPLHIAAAKGHEDLVKLFIKKGCDINALIDRDTFLPTNSFTPLTMAEFAGHKRVVAQLLEAGADPKRDVRRTSKGSPKK